MGRKLLVLAALLLLQGCVVAGSGGPKRVALVVGNSAYKYATRLKNPANDASAMSGALKGLGWQVTEGIDVTAAELRKLVDKFQKRLVGADAAIFYYGGHAIQLNHENYLMPIDGGMQAEEDAKTELVRLNELLGKLGQARTSVVFLDACRSTPFGEPGLAKVDAGAGTLIAFATAPGTVASDGGGENSPFTGALLRFIEQPGLEVTDLLRKVRRSVQAETGDAQLPWDNSALIEPFYFRERKVKRPPPP